MRETSESICEEKKTVTNEERFGYQRENDIDTDACIPRPREVSRAAAAALVSSRTERSRTLPAFAFAGGRKTTTTTSSRSKGWCFDPCMTRVLDNVKKSRVVVVVVSSRVVKKTFVDDRFVVDDASRRKMR